MESVTWLTAGVSLGVNSEKIFLALTNKSQTVPH